MNPLVQQSIDTWQVNNRINLMLLDELGPEALACTLSKRGGRTVALQFAHMHDVRLKWLEVCIPAIFKTQARINKEEKIDKALLKRSLTASADAIAQWMQTAGDDGQLKGYKKGVIFLLGYMLAHEAHHRGSILLTVKQSGIKLSDKLKWEIWDWGKI
jgi:uncharacterized damage-inducible protein DinB